MSNPTSTVTDEEKKRQQKALADAKKQAGDAYKEQIKAGNATGGVVDSAAQDLAQALEAARTAVNAALAAVNTDLAAKVSVFTLIFGKIRTLFGAGGKKDVTQSALEKAMRKLTKALNTAQTSINDVADAQTTITAQAADLSQMIQHRLDKKKTDEAANKGKGGKGSKPKADAA